MSQFDLFGIVEKFPAFRAYKHVRCFLCNNVKTSCLTRWGRTKLGNMCFLVMWGPDQVVWLLLTVNVLQFFRFLFSVLLFFAYVLLCTFKMMMLYLETWKKLIISIYTCLMESNKRFLSWTILCFVVRFMTFQQWKCPATVARTCVWPLGSSVTWEQQHARRTAPLFTIV